MRKSRPAVASCNPHSVSPLYARPVSRCRHSPVRKQLFIKTLATLGRFADACDSQGPSATGTLALLQWTTVLATHVSQFCQTALGRKAMQHYALLPATSLSECRSLLDETRAAMVLLYDCAADVDFGGVSTETADTALLRASRGGLLDGSLLLSIVGLLRCYARLSKAIAQAAREYGSRAQPPDTSSAAAAADDDRTLSRGGETPSRGSYAPPYAAITSVLLSPHAPHSRMSSSSSSRTLKENPKDYYDGLIGHILACIDEDSGEVKDTASEEVKRTRQRVRTLASRLHGLLSKGRARKIISDGSGGQPRGGGVEIVERGGRLCLVTPSTGPQPPTGCVLLGSANGMWYLEPPAAVSANNEYAAAKAEAEAAEEAVLWQLTSRVHDCAEDMRSQVLDVIVWLDCCFAKAAYGGWIDGTLPEISSSSGIISRELDSHEPDRKTETLLSVGREKGLLGGGDSPKNRPKKEKKEDDFLVSLRRYRNPLLLGSFLMEKKRPIIDESVNAPMRGIPDRKKDEVTPIDILIPKHIRGVVVTGPNTGGKTAMLRALGLAALAARAGLPIPALAPAKIPFFDNVLADIGDEQSLSASLSTFSGHVRRIQDIRKEATDQSLILLDEVGTGTDPLEGAALGIALLKDLCGSPGGTKEGGEQDASSKEGHRGRCQSRLVVATTHHSALADLKIEGDARFENASVEFDDEALAPTYRVQWGVPGRSNALNIASRLGLDADIIEHARERLGSSVGEVNDAIVALEGIRKRGEREEELAEAAQAALQRVLDDTRKARYVCEY